MRPRIAPSRSSSAAVGGDARREALGREREIVEMRFVDGLTQSQIADRIGVSQMQVSRLLTRALATMRAHAEVPTSCK